MPPSRKQAFERKLIDEKIGRLPWSNNRLKTRRTAVRFPAPSKFVEMTFHHLAESPTSSIDAHLAFSHEKTDDDRPTAIETATHAIPPSLPSETPTINNENEVNTEDNTNSDVPKTETTDTFDKTSERMIETDETMTNSSNNVDQTSSTQTNESQPSTETTQSEYVNPRGIRFTTSVSTAHLNLPTKGLSMEPEEKRNTIDRIHRSRIFNPLRLALCSWSFSIFNNVNQ